MHHDLASKIEAEVNTIIKADFIREVQYPTWLCQRSIGQKEKLTDPDTHRIPRSE